jgi:decaprenyl-phosphate phosphoribosyltransferase
MAFLLAKPRYHLSYAAVITAALLFGAPVDRDLATQLTVLYLSFNVLFYTGIYIFNDLADARADAAHPGKRERPIAAGRISVRAAATTATVLVTAGFLTGIVFFPPQIVAAYVAALVLNGAYSGGGRNLPYLDIALNSAPHGVRFLMGALLVGRMPPGGHLVTWLCLAGGVACVRRLVELEADGLANRPTLSHYSSHGLALAADSGLLIVLALSVVDGLRSPGFYLIATTGYVLVVVAARRFTSGQRPLAWLWLR